MTSDLLKWIKPTVVVFEHPQPHKLDQAFKLPKLPHDKLVLLLVSDRQDVRTHIWNTSIVKNNIILF